MYEIHSCPLSGAPTDDRCRRWSALDHGARPRLSDQEQPNVEPASPSRTFSWNFGKIGRPRGRQGQALPRKAAVLASIPCACARNASGMCSYDDLARRVWIRREHVDPPSVPRAVQRVGMARATSLAPARRKFTINARLFPV